MDREGLWRPRVDDVELNSPKIPPKHEAEAVADRQIDAIDCMHDLLSNPATRNVGDTRGQIEASDELLKQLLEALANEILKAHDSESEDKLAKAEVALCEKLLPHLNAGKPASVAELSDDEKKLMREFFLLSGKPTIFACNVSPSGFLTRPWPLWLIPTARIMKLINATPVTP